MNYIGVDIIEIARIEEAIARWGSRFLHRVYTDSELELCGERGASLAARFAGKEAVVKALGTPSDKGFNWKEIEILADSKGKPVICLYGKAQSQASNLGLCGLAISLSHSKEYAVAMVAGETGQKFWTQAFDWRIKQ